MAMVGLAITLASRASISATCCSADIWPESEGVRVSGSLTGRICVVGTSASSDVDAADVPSFEGGELEIRVESGAVRSKTSDIL